jgi:hypothetical protein
MRYPGGCRVEVSDETYEVDRGAQTLIYRHSNDRDLHWMRVGLP